MAADPRDLAIAAVASVSIVPAFSPLEELSQPGERYLAAADGLWLELRRAWLYARLPIAPSLYPLPYGTTSRRVTLVAPIPMSLIEQFIRQAAACSPKETAGSILFTESTGTYRYRPADIQHASAGAVKYLLPVLDEGDHLVVDLHSHGQFGAFFSSTDDVDDAGSVKIALVVGNCDSGSPSLAVRLCIKGMFLDISSAWGLGQPDQTRSNGLQHYR